jgi:hypothetical protein
MLQLQPTKRTAERFNKLGSVQDVFTLIGLRTLRRVAASTESRIAKEISAVYNLKQGYIRKRGIRVTPPSLLAK